MRLVTLALVLIVACVTKSYTQEYVKILTSDNDRYLVHLDSVDAQYFYTKVDFIPERISHAEVVKLRQVPPERVSSGGSKTLAYYKRTSKGRPYGSAWLGLSMGTETTNTTLGLSGGYTFNRWFSLGAGIERTPYTNVRVIPYYLEGKVRVFDKKFSPYIVGQAGWSSVANFDRNPSGEYLVNEVDSKAFFQTGLSFAVDSKIVELCIDVLYRQQTIHSTYQRMGTFFFSENNTLQDAIINEKRQVRRLVFQLRVNF